MLKGIKVDDLTCNYLKNPLGIDSPPKFSWKLHSKVRGQRQTAYRLVVASTRENFEMGIYDAWDTGKVAASDSVHINYGGISLSPRTRYWWKVIVYDMEDMP